MKPKPTKAPTTVIILRVTGEERTRLLNLCRGLQANPQYIAAIGLISAMDALEKSPDQFKPKPQEPPPASAAGSTGGRLVLAPAAALADLPPSPGPGRSPSGRG
jgi:hypothetical protein